MKKTGMALICAATLLMTGCGVSFPNISNEEADIIGEYAAITLLKYDANSRSRLVDLSQLEEKEKLEASTVPESTPTEESLPEETLDVSNTPVIDNRAPSNVGTGSVESALELPEGVSLEYMRYEICQSYQDGSQYFALDAAEGKKLLVLVFDLENASGSSQDIDLLSKKYVYRVTVDGSDTGFALTTMLDNDMSTYKGSIADGTVQEVVLVIEINAEQSDNPETISLQIKNDSKTHTIRLM